jgi:hypothetical protein
MGEHTNLPWRAAKGGFLMAPDGKHEVQIGKIGAFHDKEIAPFNKERWQADLDIIVKAVNSHEAMVKTLEALRDDPAVPAWIQTLATGTLAAVGTPEERGNG